MSPWAWTAPAGSCTVINETAPLLECGYHEFDRAGNLRADGGDRLNGLLVLLIHQGDGVFDAHGIELHRFRQALLGQKLGAVVHWV